MVLAAQGDYRMPTTEDLLMLGSPDDLFKTDAVDGS